MVTGAGGFIGRAVVTALTAAGADVVGLVRRPREPVEGVTWEVADLGDLAAVRGLFERHRPTHLVALAWEMGPGYQNSVANFHWLGNSIDHLEAFAANGGRRAVFCGSCMEYDWSGDCVMSEASTPLAASTAYGRAKAGLSVAYPALCDALGISGAWARPFFLYGPGENPRRLVADVILSLLDGREALCSHGRQKRDFLHVEDVAGAMTALLLSDVTGSVNIGSGEAVALADIIEEIGRQTGSSDLIRLGARQAPPDDPAVVEADVTRLRNNLSWTPKWGLIDGLRDTIAWWRDHRGDKGV